MLATAPRGSLSLQIVPGARTIIPASPRLSDADCSRAAMGAVLRCAACHASACSASLERPRGSKLLSIRGGSWGAYSV